MPKITSSQLAGEWWEEVGRVSAANSSQTSITATLTRSPKYLRALVYARSATATVATFWLTFNGDSAANYPRRQVILDGTNTLAVDTQSGVVLGSTAAAFEQCVSEIDIVQKAANSRKEGKVVVTSMQQLRLGAFQWSNTSSLITSVTLELRTAAMDQNSEMIILGHD